MRRIDELPLTSPFAGARMLRDLLRRAGHAIGRRYVSTLRRLSNTLTTDFCIEAVQEALASYSTPDMFNTSQGCQFTSQEFTGLLKDHGPQISMDGTGCWRDSMLMERLWRSVKYEEVYLRACDGVSDARKGLEKYFAFYNQRRPHQA